MNIKIKCYQIICLLLFLSTNLIAQYTIEGTVTDSSGPLIGATILLKNTTSGTVSNIDGRFTIKADSTDILIVSYIGYQSKEIH
mgnify:CR=1 FL=1